MQISRVALAIKMARIEAGIKQKDLAKALGVAPAYLSRVEAGGTIPSLQWIKKLPHEMRPRIREAMHAEIESELGDA
jgi:transcriptional regulator with XRE-family HTH domain